MELDPKHKTVYTLGHSNRNEEEFFHLLKKYHIDTVVDVRRYPSSLKFQHFNSGHLKRALKPFGIIYFWFGDQLGAFRPEGYTEFMLSDDYTAGIKKVTELAIRSTVVLICAEKDHTHCHRLFIADSLSKIGFKVVHILDDQEQIRHNPQSGNDQSTHTSQLDLFS